MKKLIIFFLYVLPFVSKSQAYEVGDISINVNYGGPQLTPLVVKLGMQLWYDSRWADNSYKIAIKNSGVFNGKTEYAVHENLGLGIVASYWNMAIDLKHTYDENHPTTNVMTSFTDDYHFDASAIAVGVRGNYHILGGEKRKVIDPYSGITIGITRYNFNVRFASDYPNKILPNDTYSYRTGWGTYFSGTIGLRVYPTKNIGFNAELGWDKGTFLFGGIIFKIHTKPPAFLLN